MNAHTNLTILVLLLTIIALSGCGPTQVDAATTEIEIVDFVPGRQYEDPVLIMTVKTADCPPAAAYVRITPHEHDRPNGRIMSHCINANPYAANLFLTTLSHELGHTPKPAGYADLFPLAMHQAANAAIEVIYNEEAQKARERTGS